MNELLAFFGISGPAWLVETGTAKWAIIFLTVWKGLGFSILLYLAGLQGISSNFYEAAEIDGSNAINTFFRITLPLLAPTTFYLIVTSIISGMQIYV
jgi:multiple sugar transport system permease protein